MDKLYIICVEDQRDVLDAVINDLTFFGKAFKVEACESSEEAKELIEEIDAQGDFIALVISDHVMPGTSGVDFLIEINNDDRFRNTKKMLLTGLATHEDTIKAINKAAIDHYISKPWTKEKLVSSAKTLMTEFIMDQGIPYEPYKDFLDPMVLIERLKGE